MKWNDFTRHLVIGALGAAATGLFAYLTKQDWSSFGPYAGVIQLGVQLAAEGVNQAIASNK